MNAARNMLIYCLLNVRFKIIQLLKYKCFSFFIFTFFIVCIYTQKHSIQQQDIKENPCIKNILFLLLFCYVIS